MFVARDLEVSVEVGLGIVVALVRPASPGAEGVRIRCPLEPIQGLFNLLRVRLEREPGGAAIEEFLEAASAGDEERRSAGERLERRERRVLGPQGGHDERLRAAIQVPEPLARDPTFDLHVRRTAARHLRQAAAERTAAYDADRDRSADARRHELKDPLVRLENPDEQEVGPAAVRGRLRVRVRSEVRDVDDGASEGRSDGARHEPARGDRAVDPGEAPPARAVPPHLRRPMRDDRAPDARRSVARVPSVLEEIAPWTAAPVVLRGVERPGAPLTLADVEAEQADVVMMEDVRLDFLETLSVESLD